MATERPDLLLIPADPLRSGQVDEHFAAEAAAASEAGVVIARLDHDALAAGDAVRSVRMVPAGRTALYRGWMVTSEQYAALERVLSEHEVRLLTPADRYRTAHELPGWYQHFAQWTPHTVWTDVPDLSSALKAIALLPHGPVVIRDFTKSMKHYWTEAAFIPDSADQAAVERVLARFAELRGSDIQGGFVLREFEEFAGPEVRTWWLDGECFLVSAHPDDPARAVDKTVPISQLARNVEQLGCRFVTVDLARRIDGVWRVVEIGDGHVSDRPATVAATTLITRLFALRSDRE